MPREKCRWNALDSLQLQRCCKGGIWFSADTDQRRTNWMKKEESRKYREKKVHMNARSMEVMKLLKDDWNQHQKKVCCSQSHIKAWITPPKPLVTWLHVSNLPIEFTWWQPDRRTCYSQISRYSHCLHSLTEPAHGKCSDQIWDHIFKVMSFERKNPMNLFNN